MTREELKSILNKGEGVRIEFKKAENDVPVSLYETICAFLNKEGGTILLGVTDDGDILGVAEDRIKGMLTTISTTVNNPDCFSPVATVEATEVMYQDKFIIAIKIAVSYRCIN